MSDIRQTNWGFEPTGQNAGLGGESSLSMPGDSETELGLGDPKAAWALKQEQFVQQTKRLYGQVSDVKGAMWDPRGRAALSNKEADYKTDGFNSFKENRVLEEAFPGYGGMPEPQQYKTPTDKHLDALNDPATGLSAETAAQLAEVLEHQDASVASSIYLPKASDPTVSDRHGFISSAGGLPTDFINQSTGLLYQGLATSIDSVVEGAAPSLQHVDENGVVDKYAPTTGPYDNYASNLPGGVPTSLRQPTPAEAQASPSMALRAADARVSGDGTIVSTLDTNGGIAPVKARFPWLIVLGAGTAFAGIMLTQRNK